MTRAFLPHLLKRPESHILNVSSLGGFMPFPGQSIYGASKAAMKLMTEGLYAELRNTGVRVTIVHPGAMDTHIMSNSGMEEPEMEADSIQAKMMLSAEDAAVKVIRAMEKNKFRATVGKDARLLDILYRINPRRAVNFIQRQMEGRLPGK